MSLHWAYNPLGIGGLAPYSGTRGVFLNSGAITLSSAMTMTGVTVGKHFPGNSMIVYDRGHANSIVVSGEGHLHISSGGIASSPNIRLREGDLVSNGAMFVSNGGLVYDVFNVGSVTVYSGGVVSGGDNRNTILVSGGTIYDFIQPWNAIRLRSGGQAHRLTLSGGNLTVSGNSLVTSITLTKSATLIQSSGLVSSATVLSGGTVFTYGGSANDVTFDQGHGRLSGGRMTNVQASSGALIHVYSGAVLSGGSLMGHTQSAASSSIIYVSNGGLVEDVVISGDMTNSSGWGRGYISVASGGVISNCVVSGRAYNGGLLQVNNGGHAIDCTTSRYGFYVLAGGTATRPVVDGGTHGSAQLYVYGHVEDLRQIRGTTSAYNGCYISGGTVGAGTCYTWGTLSGVSATARKSGTATLIGQIELRAGAAAAASSNAVGVASDLMITDGGSLILYGGTCYGAVLSATDIRACTMSLTKPVANAILTAPHSAYAEHVSVTGTDAYRSYVYMYDSSHISGAHLYSSGGLIMYSGAFAEDIHISNTCPGYAIQLSSGAVVSNMYRVGSHGSAGVGNAVCLVYPGATVYNLYNSGGGNPYTVLNRGIISGYHGSAILDANNTPERSYIYCNQGGKVYDAYFYGDGISAINYVITHGESGYLGNVHAVNGVGYAAMSMGATGSGFYGSSGGAMIITLTSNCSAMDASGCVPFSVNSSSVISNVIYDIPNTTPIASRIAYVFSGCSAHNILRRGDQSIGVSSIYFNIYGTATQVQTYGGGPNNVLCQVFNPYGYISGYTAGPYNDTDAFTRIYGHLEDFTHSGGWLYAGGHINTTNTAIIESGGIWAAGGNTTSRMNLIAYNRAEVRHISAYSVGSRTVNVYVSSGGLVHDGIQYGGFCYVSNGGVLSNWTMSGYGRLASNGYTARDAHIMISSGGSAYNISAYTTPGSTVDEDGIGMLDWIRVFSGGYASGVYTSGGGSAYFNGGNGAAVVNYAQLNVAAGTVTDVTNYSIAAVGETNRPAYVYNVTNSNGRLTIQAWSTASNVTIYGGTVVCTLHAHTSSALVTRTSNAIGNLIAISAGTAFDVTAMSSGMAIAREAGVIYNMTVSTEGQCHVSSGGTLIEATVNGGRLYTSSGGTVDGMQVSSGGTATLDDGGTWSNATIGPIGRAKLNSGAVAYDLYAYGDANDRMGGITVAAGAVVSNMVMSAGAYSVIYGSAFAPRTWHGSSLNGVYIYQAQCSARDGGIITSAQNRGEVWALQGGLVEYPENSGGTVFVHGGTVTNCINSTGNVYVAWNGTSSSYLSGCTMLAGRLYVSAKGSADDITMSGGTIYIYSSGIANTAAVSSGAACHISGGTLAATSLYNNGSALVSSGGFASGVIIESGCMVVYNSGSASAISAYTSKTSPWGTIKVLSGGYAENVSMYGGGGGMNGLTIEAGGVVSGLYTSNWSGTNPYTIASGTIIDFDYNYGWLYMRGPGIASSGKFRGTGSGSSGSLWKDVEFHGATTVVIGSGGVVSSCSMATGTFYLRGGTATDFVVSSAGSLLVSSGGSANKPVLAVKPCSAVVYDRGIVNSATINGGIFYMYSGATVTSTTINGPATHDSTSYQLRVSGGVAYGTTVNSNGQLYVYSGGEASNTTVNPGGSFTVSSGGLLVGTVVSGGQGAIDTYGNAMDLQMFNARVWVYSGASVTDLYVASGGSCTVSAGTIGAVSVDSSVLYCCLAGSGADIRVYNNGIMKVWGGYQVSNVTVSGTASGSSLLYVSSASHVSGLTLESKAIAIVFDGAVASGAVCNYGGSAVVSSGGYAYDTIINSGGTLIVNVDGYASGGVASNASAIAWATPPDATAQVYGTLEGLTLAGSGTRVNIRASTGLASACTATSNSYILADKGGIASNCTFNNAYLVLTANGVGRGCSASNGGSLDARTSTYLESCVVMSRSTILVRDHSVASNNTIGQGGSAIISSGGSALETEIYNSGVMWVYGNASTATVYSSGRLNTMSGGTTLSAFYASSGYGYIPSGGTESSSIVSGGQLNVFGTAYGPLCEALSGRIYVSSGGTLSGGTITTSAQIHVRDTGAAYNVTVMPTGMLTLLADGQANTVNVSGGAVVVSSGGILNDITIVSNGLLTANDGAEVFGITASAATDLTAPSIQLSPLAMAYGTITVNHARAHLAGTIETLSALDSAIVVASSGCNMMSTYLEGYDTELHVQGGAVVDTIGMEQAAKAYISSGGVISATDANNVYGTATISSGGLLHIGEFAYFEYFVCLSGGTVYVANTAEYDDYESEPGAVIIWGD